MNGTVNYSVEGAKYGISFGTALAIAISYTNNHSVLWAIIHGLFSWLYVIYYVLFKQRPMAIDSSGTGVSCLGNALHVPPRYERVASKV